LLRTIFGLERVRSGRIRVGVYSGPASPAARWAQGAGMLSEDRAGEGLAASLSIADNLTLSRLEDFGPGFLVLPSRQAASAWRWVERFGIRAGGPRQQVRELSGGNQQKVALARLLHHDVDLLVLDEPTRGIDVGSKAQIYAVLDSLASGRADEARRHGIALASAEPAPGATLDSAAGAPSRSSKSPSTLRQAQGRPPPSRGTTGSGQARPRAVLMVSSYLPELLGLCDRVAVMCRGRLGPARPTSEWTEHSLLMEASGAKAG
jgi:ribose transport system ATP-binding protein